MDDSTGSRNLCREIPVDRIDPDPEHPRTATDPDALGRLAQSFMTHGQIQPITVRPGDVPGRFTVITGARRLRAAVMAGLETVAAIILDGPTVDVWTLHYQLVENALREGLTPLDQARAFRALMDRNGWGSRKVAEELHLHHSTVARALALLGLPGPVRAHVEAGRLTPGTAREVGRLDGDDRQCALADRVVSEKLSRAATAEAVRDGGRPPAPEPAGDPAHRRVFQTSLGRVTFELDTTADRDALMAAFNEVAQAILDEVRDTPPPPPPPPAPTPPPPPPPRVTGPTPARPVSRPAAPQADRGPARGGSFEGPSRPFVATQAIGGTTAGERSHGRAPTKKDVSGFHEADTT